MDDDGWGLEDGGWRAPSSDECIGKSMHLLYECARDPPAPIPQPLTMPKIPQQPTDNHVLDA
jgi:hypothetical protein